VVEARPDTKNRIKRLGCDLKPKLERSTGR